MRVPFGKENAMKPDTTKITIRDNLNKINDFLSEVILAPRVRMMAWSKITNQTPNLKIGYPGQHLASLITGMPGTATGARGEDIVDGTEVKSCSRIDQVDKCYDCKTNVLRFQDTCPSCGSNRIKRQNDSKWLIAIRSEKELDLYLNRIPRMFFLISDYPNFADNDFSTLRFSSYEIWNQSARAKQFRQLLIDYYNKIFLAHKAKDHNKTPAPKNFWPYSYQFYLCNPIKTFECVVHDAYTQPEIEFLHYTQPDEDRVGISSEPLPVELLLEEEKSILAKHGYDMNNIAVVDEAGKKLLPLRDTSEAHPQKTIYHRR